MRSAIASRLRQTFQTGGYTTRAGRSRCSAARRRLRLEPLEARVLLAGDIHGVKWLDANADGVWGPDEQGLPEWGIYLDNNLNGEYDDGEPLTRTGNSGAYAFENLEEGVYTVAEIVPEGWRQTFPGPQARIVGETGFEIGPGAALDMRIASAEVVNYPTFVPTDALGVELTFEIVWPDWSWSVVPEHSRLAVDDGRIEVSLFARGGGDSPILAPVPRTERFTMSAGLLDAGVYSIEATLLEEDVRVMAAAPRPTRGATADLLLSRVGTHVVEVAADGGDGGDGDGGGGGDPNGHVNPDGTTDPAVRANFGNVRVEPHEKGPYIVAHEPRGTIPEPVHEVTVAFNKPINADTFTPEDVNVSIGFLDVYVPVTDVRPINGRTFVVSFDGPDVEMEYFVWIGPNIEDLAGNAMDQDRDGIAGEADDVYNAGFTVAASTGAIQGFKWNDLNGNGQRERDEPSLPDWTIFLDANDNGRLDDDETSTVTGDHGRYAFTDLSAGTYVVAEVQQEGWKQTYPGRSAKLLEAGSRPLEPGAALEFGIQGVEFVQDPDDPATGVPGAVRIDLVAVWPSTAHRFQPDATMVTVEDGRIVIDVFSQVEEGGLRVITTEETSVIVPGLGAGRYEIVATLNEAAGPMLPAYAPTWRATGVMAVETDSRHVVTLEGGRIVEGIAFGNQRIDARPPVAYLRPIEPITTAGGESAEIVIFYADPDGDVDAATLDDADIIVVGPMQVEYPVELIGIATTDPAEPALAAVYRVAAPGGTWDQEDNGLYTVRMQPEQVADLAGNFVPPGPLGTFEVRVDDTELSGITGQKWLDRNGNRQWDDGEPPLPGWTIYLDSNGNGRFDPPTSDGPGEPATETGPHGRYEFTDLEPGTYTVGEVPKPGWFQTYPGPGAELVDPVSEPLRPGNALEFGISGIDAIPRAGGAIAAEITLDVLWPNGGFQLLPQFTTVDVVGEVIAIHVIGSATGEPGIDVLVPESTTVLVPRLRPGTFTIVATLHETVLSDGGVPMLAATWQAASDMVLRPFGQHVVTVESVEPGESGAWVDGVDFGNRRGPWVVRRHVFYNHSAFDGNRHGVDAVDDRAIATDKEPLLPGQTATWANYTSYSRGINGIMIDVEGMFDPSAVGPDNFQFRVGNGGDPDSWPAAPGPAEIVARLGAGEGGSDRIVLTWADGTISQKWLQVTFRADDVTGLEADDVFYFGNAIGESGNSGRDAMVTVADVVTLRENQRGYRQASSIAGPFDVNRDGYVNAIDIVLTRDHLTSPLSALRLITAPETASGELPDDEAEPAPVAVVPKVALTATATPRDRVAAKMLDRPIVAENVADAVDQAIADPLSRRVLEHPNPLATRHHKRPANARGDEHRELLDPTMADALFGWPEPF